jgi:hypothetical protein
MTTRTTTIEMENAQHPDNRDLADEQIASGMPTVLSSIVDKDLDTGYFLFLHL